MKINCQKTTFVKTIIVILLLVVVLVSVVSCEDLGMPTSTPSTNTDTSDSTDTGGGTTVISYKEAAILAVYQHLLDLAGSPEAKLYLADFYTACDNWDAISEYFKDGSGTWHVTVDMSDVADWEYQDYWQQASWFAFRDGRVIPSNLFEGNALRIEADLQQQSLELEAMNLFGEMFSDSESYD